MNTDTTPLLSPLGLDEDKESLSSLSTSSSLASVVSALDITLSDECSWKKLEPSSDIASLLPYKIIPLANGLWLSAYWKNIDGEIQIIGIFDNFSECIRESILNESILTESHHPGVAAGNSRTLHYTKNILVVDTMDKMESKSPKRSRLLHYLDKLKKPTTTILRKT